MEGSVLPRGLDVLEVTSIVPAGEVIAVPAADLRELLLREASHQRAVVGPHLDRLPARLVDVNRTVLGDVALIQFVLIEA